MSDPQLIYCTREISGIKRGTNKQIKFQHYTVDLFEQELSKLNFPRYKNYNDINEAYNDSIQKILNIMDRLAPIKEMRVKQYTWEWFDGEIADEIKSRDKLQIDKDIYDAARCKLQKMVINNGY